MRAAPSRSTTSRRRGLRRAHPTPLPPARGPVSRALLTLLAGPPTREQGIVLGSDVTDLWRTNEVPWWEADDDVALALVCLDELDRRGLAGVDPGWEQHPLLATARWMLSRPIALGLQTLTGEAALPAKGSGCGTVRLVLAMVAAVPEPGERALAYGFRESMTDAVLVTAVQRLRERDAHLAVLPTLAGSSRQLLQRAALANEPDREIDATREAIGHVLRALDLPDRTGLPLSRLPGPMLWRTAVLAYLARRRSLRAATIGWLVAADALAAAGRVVTGAALRAHGLDAETAQLWERCVIGDLATLEAAEHVVDAEPSLAADLILGAHAALTAALAVEQALVTADRQPPSPLDPIEAGLDDPAAQPT